MQSLSSSETQTIEQASAFATLCSSLLIEKKQKIFILLSGTLGSGKSTWARGFISQWLKTHTEEAVASLVSPTYNLVKIYGAKIPVAHMDLYRLSTQEELEQIGFEQYFYETPACLVEWPEQIPHMNQLLPSHFFTVNITIKNQAERIINITENNHELSAELQNKIRK